MTTSNDYYFNALSRIQAGPGVRFPFGTVLPPAGRVIYLRSTGPQSGDDQAIAQRLETTLASALQKCRSGYNDVIMVLPGHSESVVDATMLDNLVAGTRIIGMGDTTQSNAPVFRWTATTSAWTVTVADVIFQNLKLRLEGANGVTKAIAVTGAGVQFLGNYIETASGASNKATIALEVGSAALDCVIAGNYFTGTETHNSTDVIKVVGATVPSRLQISGNTMMCSATAANGLVHITVAAKRVLIYDNIMYNTHTSSTACIAVDAVAADGIMRNNMCGTMNDGTVTAQGIIIGSGGLFKCFNNFSCDEPAKSGTLTPTAGS